MPAPDSAVAAANLRRQTPLVVVRTRQPDPPVATAAMAATDPPRATPTKRTASETGDEGAPLAKRDCTTSAVNDRQQTYLAAFRVRPL